MLTQKLESLQRKDQIYDRDVQLLFQEATEEIEKNALVEKDDLWDLQKYNPKKYVNENAI